MASHFKTRPLDKARTEMSLHVLVYDLKRLVAMLGPQSLIEAIQALNGPAIPDAETQTIPCTGPRRRLRLSRTRPTT
jgi:hypothetical protein